MQPRKSNTHHSLLNDCVSIVLLRACARYGKLSPHILMHIPFPTKQKVSALKKLYRLRMLALAMPKRSLNAWFKNKTLVLTQKGREYARTLDLMITNCNKVSQCIQLDATPQYVEDPDDFYWEDRIPTPQSQNIQETLQREHIIEAVRHAIEKLPDRHKFIIEKRYGLNGTFPATLGEVGRCLNMSRERVRQLQNEAHDMLKALLLPLAITTRQYNERKHKRYYVRT